MGTCVFQAGKLGCGWKVFRQRRDLTFTRCPVEHFWPRVRIAIIITLLLLLFCKGQTQNTPPPGSKQAARMHRAWDAPGGTGLRPLPGRLLPLPAVPQLG